MDIERAMAWLVLKQYGARKARNLVSVQNSQVTHRNEVSQNQPLRLCVTQVAEWRGKR
jgi:hypothetical protein